MTPSQKLLIRALQEYGIKEVPGVRHSTRVLKYLDLAGFDDYIKDDETAWCSTFMNAMAASECLERSNKPDARSWLNVGTEVDEPVAGDVVIFWRESPQSWKGHVAIYINQIGSDIYVLGGNQSNMVCIKPYSNDRLLGYRRLSEA